MTASRAQVCQYDIICGHETRVMGLSGGESCMILTSTVFDWITRVTDGRTDRQTDRRAIAYTHYSIYAVARKNVSVALMHVTSSTAVVTW